jgi:hypothetical protein
MAKTVELLVSTAPVKQEVILRDYEESNTIVIELADESD